MYTLRKNFAAVFLLCLTLFICNGCGAESYKHITHEDAQRIMQTNPDAIIVDVRTREEYDKEHIKNALLVPLDDLRNGDFSKLPDKNATLLVYCRTGRRSVNAAEILAQNGYKKVYEFGGIVDWTGDVEGDEQ